MKKNAPDIRIAVEQGDALAIQADVLALKYADRPYGVDHAVVRALVGHVPDITERLPKASEFSVTPTGGRRSPRARCSRGRSRPRDRSTAPTHRKASRTGSVPFQFLDFLLIFPDPRNQLAHCGHLRLSNIFLVRMGLLPFVNFIGDDLGV